MAGEGDNSNATPCLIVRREDIVSVSEKQVDTRVIRELPRNNLPIFLENPPYPPLEKGGIEGIPWFWVY
jgi:hypothetical protein